MEQLLHTMLIDAFTATPLHGNACLVILNAEGLSTQQMQAIAREANQSETAFILPSPQADFRARYFTPSEEIPLAGHPTLAVTRALIDSGRLDPRRQSFTLQLEAGIITVELADQDGDLRITMTQPAPVFGRIYPAEEVAAAFNLTPADLLPDYPIQTVSTGTPQLMLPVRDHAALRRIHLNLDRYQVLKAAGDFFSPHAFCLPGLSADAATFARHFGVPPDIYEDPFTGSATGGMAAYLWHYGLLPSAVFIAEQGHWLQRPGRAFVEVLGERTAIRGVKVGGSAVCVMTGQMRI